ncbi:MAG: hypothetical protein PHI40_06885 [Caldisericia bacterium]|nr:hypothetical protein [Caldisericia bacterium]MDD4615110.1 hypothetical protein [Caldisericia bacterium]
MTNEEQVKAHQYFSASCFNSIWNIIDQPTRSPEDLETMIHLAHTSFWHWSQNPDKTASNVSVGYWILSRVYAVAQEAENTVKYGTKCLDISIESSLSPFSIAYGYEALARAHMVAGNHDTAKDFLHKAQIEAKKVEDKESKELIETDLQEIENRLK